MIAIISPAIVASAATVAEKVANATTGGTGNGSSGSGGLLGLLRSLGQGVEGLTGLAAFLFRNAPVIIVLVVVIWALNVLGDNYREGIRAQEQHRHETAELVKALGDKASSDVIEAANKAALEPEPSWSLAGWILSIPKKLLSHLHRK